MATGLTLIGQLFGDDYLTGTAHDDTFFGLGGNDTFWTGYGDDSVWAGAGDDIVYNDKGNDYLVGGDGIDTLSFEFINTTGTLQANTQAVHVDLSKHLQTFGVFGTDSITGFENVTGGSGNDVIHGDSGANRLFGGSGNDQLFGHAGNDELVGYFGNDTMTGGAGADTLVGFQKLGSELGRHDIYRYEALSDSALNARDVIWGNFDGKSDKIDLSKIDANPFATGNNAFHFIGSNAFSLGQIGEVRSQHLTADIYLVSVDADVDNQAEMQMIVHSQHALTAADFIL